MLQVNSRGALVTGAKKGSGFESPLRGAFSRGDARAKPRRRHSPWSDGYFLKRGRPAPVVMWYGACVRARSNSR
jgi:hypothetical protein